MQSTDVDYIHNSYSRNSGYPAKFYHRQSNFNQYTMIKINEKKEKLNKYKNIKLHTSTSFWLKPREAQADSSPSSSLAWNDLMHFPSQLHLSFNNFKIEKKIIEAWKTYTIICRNYVK